MSTRASPHAELAARCAEAREHGRAARPAGALHRHAADEVWGELTGEAPPDGLVLVTGGSIEAAPSGRTWQLSGATTYVSLPADTTHLLVLSRSRPIGGRDRGVRAHRVALAARGVEIVPLPTLDLVPAARVELRQVPVSDDHVVGPARDLTVPRRVALARTALVAVAEMTGAATAALEAAVARVANRHQFGAPLGDRQAVAHRAADMHLACTVVQGVLDDALAQCAAGAEALEEAACAASLAVRMLPTVTAHAHQLHGGEGYYADRPMHRWHRRTSALARQLDELDPSAAPLAGLLGDR